MKLRKNAYLVAMTVCWAPSLIRSADLISAGPLPSSKLEETISAVTTTAIAPEYMYMQERT